jgi:hypothetical protein
LAQPALNDQAASVRTTGLLDLNASDVVQIRFIGAPPAGNTVLLTSRTLSIVQVDD